MDISTCTRSAPFTWVRSNMAWSSFVRNAGWNWCPSNLEHIWSAPWKNDSMSVYQLSSCRASVDGYISTRTKRPSLGLIWPGQILSKRLAKILVQTTPWNWPKCWFISYPFTRHLRVQGARPPNCSNANHRGCAWLMNFQVPFTELETMLVDKFVHTILAV